MFKKNVKRIGFIIFIFFSIYHSVNANWCYNGETCYVYDKCNATCCTGQDNSSCESDFYDDYCWIDSRGLCVISTCDPCPCGCNTSTGDCNTCCTPRTSCPDSTCTDSGYSASATSYWTINKTCSDGCSGTLNKTCYCTGDCSLQSCEAGTSTNVTIDIYDTYSCTNDCSKPNSKSCYCDICTPPLCGPAYEISDQGYGDIILSCRNGTPETPNRTSKCDLTDRTCYCRDCLKVCPLPLEETEQYISKGYNLGGASTLKLEDFRRCTNDCDVGPNESNDDCYEVESPQPVETFSIVDTAVPLNKYDFKDQSMFPYSHTGQYDASNFAKQGDLNDPTDPIEMIATYTDSDGASDIEGMFVWFRSEDVTGPYGMPVHISSATPQGPAQNSWGFMLKRSGTGWLPYVTSFQPSTPVWTRVVYEHYPDIPEYAKFFLPAPNQTDMIEVTVIPAPTVSADGKSITMKFSLRFTNNGNLFGTQKASEGKYKILLMGLDKFSFTPFDNYDVAPDLIDFASFWDSTYLLNGDNFTHYWTNTQLRYIDGVQSYARDWFDTGKTWTLDFTDPYFNPNTTLGFTKEVIENSVKVSWNVKDNQNLFAIVGNIYVDGSNQKPLTLFDETAGVILRGSEIYPLGPDDTNTVIGKLVKDDLNSRTWSFKVNPNLSTDSHTGSVTIGVGDNTVGNLIVWLTVFDDAGNVARTSISQGLSDRFLTGGGLVFSPTNNFSTLPLPNDATNWTNILPPYSSSPSEGLIKGNAGFTSEMYANSGAPSNSGQTKSYGLRGFSSFIRTNPPYSNPTPPLYDSLKRKYELHKKYLQATSSLYENLSLGSNFSNFNLVSCPINKYCVYSRTGNLTTSPNLACNKNVLIFVSGILTINTPINSTDASNLSNLNGCIFVVGGSVTIAANPVANGTFSYDKINAFIVSDGVITIAHDPDSTTIVDGVYINGGLISRGGADSIDILRYLRLQERLVYPVFAIDLHPKYGILAEKFFGNSYVIQSTEVGLKPY